MEVDAVFTVIKIVIRGTHFFNILPFKWNADSRQLYFVTGRKKVYWWITEIVMFLLKIIVVSKYSADVLWFGKFEMGRRTDIINILLMSICALSAYFDYDFIAHSVGLMDFANDSFFYSDKFTGMYAKKQEKKNSKLKLDLASGVTAFLIEGLVFLGVAAFPLAFMFDADSHVFAPVYSLRHLVGWKSSTSAGITILLYIIQGIIGFYVVGSFIFLTLYSSACALISVRITNELSADEDRALTKPELREWDNWTNCYRTWQMLMADVNTWLCNELVAVVFGFFLCENVLILYIIIKVDLALPLISLAASYQVVLLFMYFAFFWAAFKRTENLAKALQKNAHSIQNAYQLKHMKSFRPVYTNIGRFAKIESETLFLFIDIVISQTVDLIIFSEQAKTS